MAEKWSINFSDDVKLDLAELKNFHRQKILDVIYKELEYSPFSITKRKKPATNIAPEFKELGIPVWQLKIAPFRVLYTLDSTGVLTVLILEVFEKPNHKTTEDSR